MKKTSYLSLAIALLIFLLFFPFLDILAQSDTTSGERLAARIAGPFHLRFILQPLVAIILGVKDGRTDAKLGKPPYIFDMFRSKAQRRTNLKDGLQSILTPLIIGIVLDAVVQFNLFHTVHVWGALLVGACLVGIPYSLARGIRNRIGQKYGEGKQAEVVES